MAFSLFVPPLGARLMLAEPWSFRLYNERRNATLMALLGDTRPLVYGEPEPSPATLPAGTVLIIDRYYIRQGMDGYDSVSFRIAGASAAAPTYPHDGAVSKRQVRFWVKLEDVNTMRVELAPAEAARPPAARSRRGMLPA